MPLLPAMLMATHKQSKTKYLCLNKNIHSYRRRYLYSILLTEKNSNNGFYKLARYCQKFPVMRCSKQIPEMLGIRPRNRVGRGEKRGK